jgi:hypothetical protein
MGNEGRPKTNPEFQRLMIKQSFSLIALSVGLSVFSQTHVPVTHDEIIKVAAADFPDNSDVVTTAEFPGGMQKCMQFVNKSFKVPEDLKMEAPANIRMVARFVVETDGSLTNIQVFRDNQWSTGKQLIRILHAMPKWTPAMDKEGNPVRSEFTLPVTLYVSAE